MRAEIIKELRYAFRSGRVLILFASFFFFAILTPVMMKLVLPQILENQLSQEAATAIGDVMNMTQLACIQSYMGDVFEIGVIIIAFTLCGITASEIRNHTWVLPLSSGKRLGHMITAKLLVFGCLVILVPLASLLVNYAYSGLLFDFEIGILPIIYGGLLQGAYMVFLVSCLIFWGAILKKPIPTGLSTLATVYGIHFISSLFTAQKWTPSGLLSEALTLTPKVSSSLFIPLAITTLLIIILLITSLFRLKNIEWNNNSFAK